MARRNVLLLMVLILGLTAFGVWRERTVPRNDPAGFARAIMSPFCPGLTLAACPSSSAFELRAEVTKRARDGESQDAIMTDLVARYGDIVLGTPETTGYGLMVWLAPGLIGVLLLGLVVTVGRHALRQEPPPPVVVPTGGAGEQLAKQLDDDLLDLD
ncbi:MAG: cytochrome c-type biogenesis protein CcmH [Acidobacteria bacterium]|nr:cytochrome c-type biogenesis protein CcmH [Acidobacteriota bacterium]